MSKQSFQQTSTGFGMGDVDSVAKGLLKVHLPIKQVLTIAGSSPLVRTRSSSESRMANGLLKWLEEKMLSEGSERAGISG
jgi:hypothetical protein